MEAKDFMIGDFVLSKSDDKIYKINSIITQDDGSILFATEDGLHFDYMYEAIQLTYKILEENGFQGNESDGYWCKVDNNEIKVSIFNKEVGLVTTIKKRFSNCYTLDRCITNHVHEFQNILRLCGINKEIEL